MSIDNIELSVSIVSDEREGENELCEEDKLYTDNEFPSFYCRGVYDSEFP